MLRTRLPDPVSILGALRGADRRWAVSALAAGLLSQLAYAEQQRRLLAAFAVHVPPRRAVAMTYVRSALSMALPAGAAASAAYAFQIYRRHGATSAVSAAATLISSVVTALSLGLLCAATWSVPLTAALLAAAAAVPWIRRRPALSRRLTALPLLRRPAVRRALRDARTVEPRTWIAVLLAGLVNWLLDMGCLLLAADAAHAGIGWDRLALIYLTVQIVRQIPLTPGGIGLIETSMLAGLIAAGTTQAAAAVAVLIYRLISFWLILPAGLTAHLLLRRHSRTAA